jgi:uncharacterized lipoprotein YajG
VILRSETGIAPPGFLWLYSGAVRTPKNKTLMKYMLLFFAAVLLFTGCASNKAGSPGEGSYTDSSNDRYSNSRVSNNLRTGGAFGR